MSGVTNACSPCSSSRASADDYVRACKSSTDNIPERHDSTLEEQSGSVAAPNQTSGRAEHLIFELVFKPNDAHMNATIAPHSDELMKPLLHTAIADGAGMSSPSNKQEHQRISDAGLHLKTNVSSSSAQPFAPVQETPTIYETPVETVARHTFTSPIAIAATTSSLRSNLSTNSITSSHSPASTSSMLASPYLAAMQDLTPLPSPIMSSEQSNTWQKHRHGSSVSSRPTFLDDSSRAARAYSVSSIPIIGTSPRRRKQYGNVAPNLASSVNSSAVTTQDNTQVGSHHGRNRSVSEFVPEHLHNVRQRVVTIGSDDRAAVEYQMQREAHLAGRRGIVTTASDPSAMLPSPPPSNTSVAESDDAEEDQVSFMDDDGGSEYLHIHCGIHQRLRRFRQIRQLGQGTFSKVVLATSQRLGANSTAHPERDLDPSKVVAVKIVEHGPAGGADEERIVISLRREVEMLKTVSHPSLIRLKACEDQMTRTLLVLTYCPGGDLFELASDSRDLLTPPLIQRIFAELISAVRYLHLHWIVHRDVKLENVLVNYSTEQLRQIQDPITHPTPIITLSDLGLSRRMPDPPEPPLLTMRCGSEDYAAPEILLGQPYDGRLTDGWALGVLLYALMEGRLPFDAPPGKPDRSRNTHRIARCDWIWCRFGDDDGGWDPQRGLLFEGGRLCVEGLLKKVRMGRKPLEEIERLDWVQQGIQVPGGLRMRAMDLDELQ